MEVRAIRVHGLPEALKVFVVVYYRYPNLMYAVRRMYLPGATFNCYRSIAIEGNGTGSVKLTHGLSAMKHKLGGSTPAVRRKVDDPRRELSHRLSFDEYCSGVL